MARAIGGARSSASEDLLAGKIERPSQGMPEPCIIGASISLVMGKDQRDPSASRVRKPGSTEGYFEF
jgi:hypothetical protein